MTYPSGPYGYGYAPPPPKPGVIPLAPLTFGQILTGVFTTYGRYWKPLLGIAVTAYGVATAIVGGAMLFAWNAVSDNVDRLSNLPAHQDPEFADFQALFVAFGCVWLTGAICLVLATGLVSAAAPAVAQEAVLGRPLGFGATWRRAWSRLGAVLGSVFLTMLATFVPVLLFLLGWGFLMFGLLSNVGASAGDEDFGPVVAGGLIFLFALAAFPLSLWLWVKFSLAPAAAVIEGADAVAAMRRSSALVRGSWWRVFGCTLAMAAMVAVAGWVVQQVFSLLAWLPVTAVPVGADASPGEFFAAMAGVLGFILLGAIASQAVLAPFQPLVSAFLYVDQRIRKENLGPALAQSAGVA